MYDFLNAIGGMGFAILGAALTVLLPASTQSVHFR